MSLENIIKKIDKPKTSGMVEYMRDYRTVTLAEIREIVEANPKHPYSAELKRTLEAWAGSGDGREFHIDKAILVGVIENRNVEEVCEFVNGRERRTLGVFDKLGAKEEKEAKDGKK